MELYLYALLGIWLIIGVISAILVYYDMKELGEIDWKWPIICLLLSIVGAAIYYFVRPKTVIKGRELPPKPDYGKPEYRFEDDAKVAEHEERPEEDQPQVPVLETSQAPSAHVEETGPAMTPEPPSTQAVIEEKPAPKPKVTQIEGIPRCQECGAAVSSHDEKCPRCDAKLKG